MGRAQNQISMSKKLEKVVVRDSKFVQIFKNHSCTLTWSKITLNQSLLDRNTSKGSSRQFSFRSWHFSLTVNVFVTRTFI